MFEPIVDEDERGQVGIGTLIVFIAMVLVAAIAAGVLINTAGVLQTQASDTGSETQEAVANQIEVTHAAGHVNGDVIDQVDMTLMKSAGSNAIDLEAMTVQYTSSSTDATLTYEDGNSDADHFDTEELAGDNGGTSLTSTDDRAKLILDTAALEGGSSDENGLVDVETSGDSVTSVTLQDEPTGDGNIEVQISGDGAPSGSLDAIIDETDIATDLSNGDMIDSGQFEDSDMLGFAADGSTTPADETEITVNTVNGGLASGSSATVSLVDQSGAEFTYGISVPSTFGNKAVVEV